MILAAYWHTVDGRRSVTFLSNEAKNKSSANEMERSNGQTVNEIVNE